MAIDASIILGLKPPPDPTEEFAKFQGARNMIAQGQAQQQAQQLNQQKIQEGQLALQEAQRHQQSQEAVRQGFIQANGNPEGTIAAAIKNGAGPDEITALQKHFTGIQKDTAEIDSKELPVKLEKSADILRLHDYASQLAQSNPQQYMQEWPQIAARAKELDPKAADHVDPNTPWTPQQIATSKALHMTQDYFLKSQAEERAAKTTAADIADKNAQAALAGAKTPGAKAESDIAQQKADLMKNYQAGKGPHPIDTALPPELDKTANAAFKSSFDFAMKSGGPEAAQKVLEAAATHAASSSPEKLNADIGKAVATERALTPLKINQAVQTEIQKARLAGGIGQIVDPQQRSEASHALDAADKEAQEKISAAAALKNTVSQALSGNKVAPSLETIELLRSQLNRINGTELKSVGGVGDAYDQAVGFISKWTKGQPIPDNIQKDYIAVADAQQKLAQVKHATAYGTVAQRFGVKDLKPPDIAGIYANAAGGGVPTPASQKEYDALAKGAKFKKPNDSTVYTKQ